jgi:hypothetical protein
MQVADRAVSMNVYGREPRRPVDGTITATKFRFISGIQDQSARIIHREVNAGSALRVLGPSSCVLHVRLEALLFHFFFFCSVFYTHDLLRSE